MSFNEASEDTGFFNIFPPAAVSCYTGRFGFLFLSYVPLHLPYVGKCQNNEGPDTTDRIRCPEVTDRRQHSRR